MEETRKNGMIVDVDEFPKSKWHAVILAIQHILAMFVACITVPLIVFSGFELDNGLTLAQVLIAPTIVSAGVGTLFYLFMTKFKSPMFLASSFAYLGPMASAVGIGVIGAETRPNLWLLPIGMAMVGAIYCIVALLIKLFGTKWIHKLLPPIVIGPVIMVIGLGLAGSAINNLNGTNAGADYNIYKVLCGLIALAVTAICAHYGKKTISLIPFVIGMGAGYVAAWIFTGIGYYGCHVAEMQIIDAAPIEAWAGNFTSGQAWKAFVDLPGFLFLQGDISQPLTWSGVGQAAALFIPVSLVTICEHIGDHENMSGVIQKNLIEEPGLSRTLIGDGVATAISGIVCGAANTTYGENVAVVGVTKVASTKVIALACCLAILIGFISPLTMIAQTIPACVTGGVSLVLYGFIASSGVKMLVKNQIDMGNTKNMFVASTILVAGIGGLALSFAPGFMQTVSYSVVAAGTELGDGQALVQTLASGDLLIKTVGQAVSGYAVTITSTAVGMILGILMNVMLKDKKEEKAPEAPAPEAPAPKAE